MKNKFYLSFVFIYSISLAEIFYVPDEFSTIQDAINAASNGDSVMVSPGFYPENINFEGKSITVSSLYSIENDSLLIGATIIDAQENGSVATFANDENDESILQGFTLQNGSGNDEDPDGNGSYYTYGGGVYCEDSSPLIKDCIIQNNIANEGGGGGIFCYNASPVFVRCQINGNETDDVGGGLYSRSESSPELYYCSFYDNTAEFGGGCYMRNESTPIMQNVIFNANTALNSGGGITLKDDADLEAYEVHIINNDAEGLGGGIYINNADPEFVYCLVADNSSSSGGGVYIRNNSIVELSNTTIANNSANLDGNGIYMRDNVEVVVFNTIVWNNGSPQIHFRSNGTDVQLDVEYSMIQNGEDGVEVNDNGDLNWGFGNLDEEPYFCNISDGDYYVRENSPCLDGGANGSLIGCFQAGCGPVNLGPVWYVGLNGNNTNDGSFEAPFETIARAFSSAGDGDTIRLIPGVYTEFLDFDGKEVVLESMAFDLNDNSLISETIFGPGALGGSCLTIEGSSNDNATIRGFSFIGGSNQYGGGIIINNSSLTLSDLIIEDNSADFGGGIYLSESDAILNNIVIRNNGANEGGGVYISGGLPILNNVVVQNNIGYWGGGLYIENAQPIISYGTIKNNEAFIEGAGMYQIGGSSFVEWTAFEYNNGYDYGGAVVANQASIDINQATFSGNISGVGSAMSIYSSVITMNNSILWGNVGPPIYAPESSGINYFNVHYSDIEGGEELFSDYENILFSSDGGVINVDPEFCSTDLSDHSLRQSSLCRTASDSLGVIGAFSIECETLGLNENHLVSYSILKNYPNPFNPLTCIQYSLDDFSHFSLKVFDIHGSLIKTLKKGYGSPGIYEAIWDSKNDRGINVPSGIYFYQLSTISNITTNRMMLIK